MNGKILVVDDEATTRSSLADILELEGYTVAVAEDGEAAINSIQEIKFDLILLDIMMPGIGGMEVLRRAMILTPNSKIILLTAHGSMDTAIEALRAGAHDYLLKPASPEEILETVARGLASRNEKDEKRRILEQIETGLQKLKDAEGIEITTPVPGNTLTLGEGIKVDLERREIWHGNMKVQLTPTEGKLMKVLLENQGRVLSHRELVLMVQGYKTSDWEAPEILRPLVSRLRRKLSQFEGGKHWIVNVRGTGYVFDGSLEE